MNKKSFITALLALAALAGQGHDVVDWYRGFPLHRRGR